MRETLENGLDKLEQAIHKAYMPAGVTMAFLDALRRATHSNRERKQIVCEEAWKAMECQDTLGTFAILRGHHHMQWADAIEATWKKPNLPPRKDGKPPKTRSPFDLSAYLVVQVWNLFNQIWESRNDILHSNDSYAAKAKESHLTT